MRWKECKAGHPVGREQKMRGIRASVGIGDVPESQYIGWMKGFGFRLLKISVNQLEGKSHNR